MLNNYPDKQKNQHEPLKFAYKKYLDTLNEVFVNDTSSDTSADVEIEMARSIYDMRREFKRITKKLRKLYSSKEPKISVFEYDTAKSARLRLKGSHAIG